MRSPNQAVGHRSGGKAARPVSNCANRSLCFTLLKSSKCVRQRTPNILKVTFRKRSDLFLFVFLLGNSNHINWFSVVQCHLPTCKVEFTINGDRLASPTVSLSTECKE